MMTSFIPFFQQQYPFLKSKDFEQLLSISREQTLEKGEPFINLNDRQQRVGIVLEGLLRGYMINYEGKEVTRMFRSENMVVAAYETVLLKQASRQIIEALEPTRLLSFQFQDLEKLNNPNIHKATDAILQELLVVAIQRTEGFIMDTPPERYKKMLATKGFLVNRVPQKHLASFLGITPQSFSRIKKRLLEEQ